MREKLEPLRKRSLCEAKKAQAINSARRGPRVASGGRGASSLPGAEVGGAVARWGSTATAHSPQQFSVPNFVSLLSTRGMGLSVMSVTPVSVYPDAFFRVFAYSTPASTPMAAIFSGYCCEVAARWPAFTFFTPTQPPSTETIKTPFCLPADLSAWYAPAAAGSLMV